MFSCGNDEIYRKFAYLESVFEYYSSVIVVL